MNFTNQTIENGVEEYMQLIHRMDELVEKLKQETGEDGEPSASAKEHLEDIDVIRQQLITKVKECGISKDLLDNTRRLLSIF